MRDLKAPALETAAVSAVLAMVAPVMAQRTERVAGRVLDVRGGPAAGARVHLVARQHPELPARIAARLSRDSYREQIATADDRGRFALDVRVAGPFGLYAERGAGAMSGMRFPVSPGDYVDLRLEVTSRTTVRVTQLGGGGGGAPGAVGAGQRVEARVLPDDMSWASDLPYSSIRVLAHTDDRGVCVFGLPKRRRFSLRATLGKRHVVRWPEPDGGEPVLFSGSLHVPYRGKLIDKHTRAPVANALVHDLYHPAVHARTDGSGDFVLKANPVSFLHVVPAAHQRRVLGPQTDGQRRRGVAEVFELVAGQKLSAQLVDRQGEPVRGARVVFAGVGTNVREDRFSAVATWEHRTDEAGRIEVRWLEPGVPLAGFVEVRERLVWFLFRASHRSLDLRRVRVSGTAAIEGKVDGPDRTPLVGAHVYLQPQMPRAEAEALLEAPPGFFSRITCTDRGGRFRFDGLRAGTYELAVDAPGRGRVFTTAVAGLPPPGLRLTLAAGEELRGVVVDKTHGEKPVSGAGVTVTLHRPPADWQLSAWRFDLLEYRAVTDADGRFVVAGLPKDAVCRLAVRRYPESRSADTVLDGVHAIRGEVKAELR